MRRMSLRWKVAVAMLPLLLLPAIRAAAQGSPRVTGVEPTTAKVGATVTVTGENLTRANVTSVYLSDNNDDYKAVVVEQASNKIVVRIPKVKPGDYNISIEIKSDILIQPVRIAIQE